MTTNVGTPRSIRSATSGFFKLSHDDLGSLLPVKAFGSLDTALQAIGRTMNHDRQIHDVDDMVRGLAKALTVLAQPPLHVLSDIREWALEFLLQHEDHANLMAPLQSPDISEAA